MTPTRYPLQWPPGWKRTPDGSRKDANFKRYDNRLTITDGVKRVLTELERFGVREDDVVISTNVQTRLDGFPRSGLPAPTDPGVCVYWNPARGQSGMKCMAIDRYDKVADNLAAVAATLEAMRAIERHGGGTILDRAFTGFTALPAPIVAGMKRDWQVVLGLQELLLPTIEDVQNAYRRLASTAHPDKGGSTAAMAELNQAREDALKELE